MMSGDDIQRQLFGAWRLMLGRDDGLRLLYLSADGFWNSFFAIVISLPPLIVGWLGYAGDSSGMGDAGGGRLGILARLAVVDLGTWLLPLLVLAAAAPRAAVADRFVAYVVATNWASVLLIWLMLPAAMLRLLIPTAMDIADGLSFLLFLVSLALTWRLTTVVIGRGMAVGTAVFAGMFFASLVVLLTLQHMVGLDFPDQATLG